MGARISIDPLWAQASLAVLVQDLLQQAINHLDQPSVPIWALALQCLMAAFHRENVEAQRRDLPCRTDRLRILKPYHLPGDAPTVLFIWKSLILAKVGMCMRISPRERSDTRGARTINAASCQVDLYLKTRACKHFVQIEGWRCLSLSLSIVIDPRSISSSGRAIR